MRDVQSLDSAEATVAAGRRLAAALRAAGLDRATIYLCGDLGAGKTTLARGFLAGCGHCGRVPSPTYTLVEPYEFDEFTVYHIDLYRLGGAAEVDELGLADLDGAGAVLLIEWPERAAGCLPGADLELTFTIEGRGRTLRRDSLSAVGVRLLERGTG
ncbi:MAG: tRNA (adenosine(37)-N6)-threonylcarbamoyltransferase complex ATPase subunit type 1 TsaE [Gammaproteobacteria bacterium]